MVAFECRITEDSGDLPGYTQLAPVVLSSPGMQYDVLSHAVLSCTGKLAVTDGQTHKHWMSTKGKTEGNYSKAANNQ